jgi:sterol desaturase/sphingolipid hydroxylase (fatty acid hydroxylase superfamily)
VDGVTPARALGRASQAFDRLVRSEANYRAVMIVDLFGAAAFLLFGIRTPMPVAFRIASIAAGFAAWGFLEYALHRWLGHGPPSVGRRGHAMHHAHDTAPVAAPVFVVMAGAWAIWAALALPLGNGVAALVVCGIYSGYNHYALVHHVLHHHEALAARLGLARMGDGHRLHHQRHDVNFGVTSSLWDRIFRTYEPGIFSKTSRS